MSMMKIEDKERKKGNDWREKKMDVELKIP